MAGELSIQTFHTPTDPNADPYQLPPLVDNSYRLVDKTEDGSKYDTAVDLEDHTGLITGDKLTTGLTLELPQSIADLVNAGEQCDSHTVAWGGGAAPHPELGAAAPGPPPGSEAGSCLYAAVQAPSDFCRAALRTHACRARWR